MRGIAKGMATVARHVMRPSVTQAYPWEPKVLPERSRTSFALPRDETGMPACKSCGVCMKTCPTKAIRVTSEKRADGPGRILTGFEIDLGLCMYCGLCVEGCPASGLRFTGDFETATPRREDTVLVLFRAPAQTLPHEVAAQEDASASAPAAPDADASAGGGAA